MQRRINRISAHQVDPVAGPSFKAGILVVERKRIIFKAVVVEGALRVAEVKLPFAVDLLLQVDNHVVYIDRLTKID